MNQFKGQKYNAEENREGNHYSSEDSEEKLTPFESME